MSKRNIIYISVASALILAAGVWYFFTKNSSLPQYIPAKAMVVMKVNPLSIARKLDLDEIKNMKAYDQIMDELNDGGMEVSEMFESPEKTGISLTDNMYFFTENDQDDQPGMAFLFAVSDHEKLRDYLEKFAKKSHLKYKESGDYYMYVNKDPDEYYTRLSIVWNDDVCMMYSSRENSLSNAKKILKQSKDKSILSSDAFNASEDRGGDMSLFVNNSSLQSALESQFGYGDLDEIIPEKFKDYLKNIVGSSVVLNFNDDNISIDGIQYFKDNKKAEELALIGENGLTNEGLEFVSANGKVLMGMSAVLNMDEIFKLIKPIPNYDELAEEIENSIGVSEKELRKLLDGSFVFSINDIKIKEVEKLVFDYDNYDYESGDYQYTYKMVPQAIPTFSIQVGLDDVAVYRKFMNKLQAMGNNDRVQKDGNMFTIQSHEDFGNIHVVQVDKKVVITNDETAAKDLKANGKWNTKLNSEVSSLFKDNPVAGYWDMDVDNYGGTKKLKTLMGVGEYENKKFRLMMKMMETFKSLTFNGNLEKSNVRVNFKSGKGNSLMRIIRLFEVVANEKKS